MIQSSSQQYNFQMNHLRERRGACRKATSKYLMIVPQKCLKTSALFLQEPQGFLPQQPRNLAHRKAAWRAGKRDKQWKMGVIHVQEEVYWFYNHQCINTVLQHAQRSFLSSISDKEPLGLSWCYWLFYDKKMRAKLYIHIVYKDRFTVESSLSECLSEL